MILNFKFGYWTKTAKWHAWLIDEGPAWQTAVTSIIWRPSTALAVVRKPWHGGGTVTSVELVGAGGDLVLVVLAVVCGGDRGILLPRAMVVSFPRPLHNP